MKRFTLLRSAAFAMISSSALMAADEKPAPPLYELRTYHATPGKLDALHARFREHTMKLFEKHGMTNVGYWVPLENPDSLLIYLLSYPDKAARETAWEKFLADPDWKAAQAASEAEGPIVSKIESRFLTPTDFSPVPKATTEGVPHTFELRTYTTTPGNLPLLLKRFRDHTMKFFTHYGMTNLVYFTPAVGDPDAENTLIYFLQHASAKAQEESFKAFRADPEWIKVKEASEKEGGGSLTVLPDGVKSLLLVPTDYSPIR
jgi:hypothetical protein